MEESLSLQMLLMEKSKHTVSTDTTKLEIRFFISYTHKTMLRPYVNFKSEWLGKRINYDGAFGFQCVDLAKLYLDKGLGF